MLGKWGLLYFWNIWNIFDIKSLHYLGSVSLCLSERDAHDVFDAQSRHGAPAHLADLVDVIHNVVHRRVGFQGELNLRLPNNNTANLIFPLCFSKQLQQLWIWIQ